MGLYPKLQYEKGRRSAVLQPDRVADTVVSVRPDVPGNVIVIHGVNDVGVGFDQVEQGLCAGLNRRLLVDLQPGSYRMPTSADKKQLYDDPDDVFFKRTSTANTNSPVIPFYWGYAESFKMAQTRNGQKTDRYGNRLDKDLSKGGGPFVNATSTLPDMWNRGANPPLDAVGDALRPLLKAPGRMYMVLAAKRLAALIAMIRDYDGNDVVSLVAHSQGTMISLLAQAFLMDQGLRPADTLVLMNSPYSLEQDTTMLMSIAEAFTGGEDAAMGGGQYSEIQSRQAFDARLSTLVNIVHGIAAKKSQVPPLAVLGNPAEYRGMVGGTWVPDQDRDNRGKVYLYFSPEDMTVALDNVRGIGWQGVPDCPDNSDFIWLPRRPMDELCKPVGTPAACAFYQRVFTNRRRFDLASKQVGPVEVGQAPHDFALHVKGEDEQAHVAASNRGHRGSAPEVAWPVRDNGAHWYESNSHHDNALRNGIRRINGEALAIPHVAELQLGQVAPKDIPRTSDQAKLPADKQGPCEQVDPIDAAIAISTDRGLKPLLPQRIAAPRPKKVGAQRNAFESYGAAELHQLQEILNRGKEVGDRWRLIDAMDAADGMITLTRFETPNEARLRWQNEFSPTSFHGAIFGSKANHEHVTAYDLAIGGGKASSHPHFYAYLCAVADWRLKIPQKSDVRRPSILQWSSFVTKFASYWNVEPPWRQELIRGNARYYSNGELPTCIPGLRDGLPTSVVCQRTGAKTMNRAVQTAAPASTAHPVKQGTKK